MRLAEISLRKGKADPECNCKFRLLKAQLRLASDLDEVFNLLAAPCPVTLDATEFPVRREVLLGWAYASVGQPLEADRHLAEADRLAASSAPQLLAGIALKRGQVAGTDYERARSHFAQAAERARKYALPEVELDAQGSLGFTLIQQQDFSRAKDQFLTVLGLIKKLPRTHDHALAEERALGNLGYSYLELGDFGEAMPLLEKAESAAAALEDNLGEADSALTQGNAYLSLHELPEAQTHYGHALQVALKIHDTYRLFFSYHDLAQLEVARGNPDGAEGYNRKAYDAKGPDPDDRYDDYLALTTAEIAKLRKQVPQAEKLLRSLLDRLEARVRNKHAVDASILWQAQSDIAEVYVALGKYDDAEKAFRKAVHTVEDFDVHIPKDEDRMSVFDAGPFYDDYIQLLVDREAKNERALQTAEVSRARTLKEVVNITAQQPASGLQVSRLRAFLAARRQIILAYWLSDKESYLWVITPESFKLFHLPGKSVIEAAVNANDHQIQKDHRKVGESTAGRRLYDMLIKPARDLIPKDARVTIIPSQSLYKLNFETLVVPDPKPHYWIEDVQVDNASSIALLVGSNRPSLRVPDDAPNTILVMGAPVEADKNFPTLERAEDELKMVAGHYPARAVLAISGKAATPGAYRSSNPGRYRYIYFGSHGTADATRPLDSAIILSPDADGSYKLQARDIKDVPLHADLVTISACYGLGSKAYSGEGLVGLAWAFMRAGAHQVIAALWAVDEDASLPLMNDFYNGFTKGKSAAAALREAKLKMVHSQKADENRAYYWASLQLYTGY